MLLGGKEVKDECSVCGNVLSCDLCKDGHGIRRERTNIAQMVKCQLEHQQRRLKAEEER